MIAGLGVSAGLEPQLGRLAAAYVLFLAVLPPVLARTSEPLFDALSHLSTRLSWRPWKGSTVQAQTESS